MLQGLFTEPCLFFFFNYYYKYYHYSCFLFCFSLPFFFLFKFTLLDNGFLLLLLFSFPFLFLFLLALLDKKSFLIGLPYLYDPKWLFSFWRKELLKFELVSLCWKYRPSEIDLNTFLLSRYNVTWVGLFIPFYYNNINLVLEIVLVVMILNCGVFVQ